MMNKFILDFNNDLDPYCFIVLAKIYNSIELSGIDKESVIYLQDYGLIKIISDENNEKKFILREKGKQLIESCIYKESDEYVQHQEFIHYSKEEASFDVFIKEYRNLWKGLKVGSQGNPKSVEDKMIRWMKENPDYSQQDILRAAKSYINSLDDFKYLQKADYFIYKRDKYGESSRLSDFIDEDEITEDGWSSILR